MIAELTLTHTHTHTPGDVLPAQVNRVYSIVEQETNRSTGMRSAGEKEEMEGGGQTTRFSSPNARVNIRTLL